MTDIRKDLETAAVAMADFEGGSIFRETLLNAIAALDAIELAYGLLWRCGVDWLAEQPAIPRVSRQPRDAGGDPRDRPREDRAPAAAATPASAGLELQP